MKNLVIIILAILALSNRDARAQAWVGEGGNLSAGFDASYGFSDRIVYEDDQVGIENVKLNNNIVVFNLSYNPLDNLAFDLSLPAMAVKLSENGTFSSLGRYDTGSYHFNFENLRAELRYQLPIEFLALTPSIGATLPVAKYEVQGNAGLARGLKAVRFGLAAGKVISKFYLHATYQYGLVERFETNFDETADIGQNFSEWSFLVGYFVNDRLHVNAAVNGRFQHDGIRFIDFPALNPVERDFYNAILKEKFVYAGLGAQYQLTDTLSASAQLSTFVWGENTTNQKVVGLGLDWQIR